MNQHKKNYNFISKSVKKHGENIFDYSEVMYKNTTTQVDLICNKHNFQFKITPFQHLKGAGGCPICFKSSQHLLHANKKVGEKFTTNEGYEIEIIDYINSTNCEILFNDGTVLKNKHYKDIIRGQIRNPNKILDLGYIGLGDFSWTKHKKIYVKWYNMLNRCYNNADTFKSYKDVTVCEEWHNFQNFAAWYEENYNPETMQGWQLDKDILVKDNKVYSPETCCFVPKEINCLFLKSNATRGKYPIGVSYVKSRDNFYSHFKKKELTIFLGYFNTSEEAFGAYKTVKEKYIKEVADKWIGKISEKVYNAMYNYQVEIDD